MLDDRDECIDELLEFILYSTASAAIEAANTSSSSTASASASSLSYFSRSCCFVYMNLSMKSETITYKWQVNFRSSNDDNRTTLKVLPNEVSQSF